MERNPILEEIYQIRLNYAERFGNDLHAICQDAIQKQGYKGRRVVQANPKPALNQQIGRKILVE